MNGRRAFALIESVVSASIFILGLTAIVSTMGIVEKTAAAQRELSLASRLVKDVAEGTMLLPRTALVTVPAANFNADGDSITGTGMYRVTTTSSPLSGAPSVLRLTFVVRWRGSHSLTLITYRS